MSGGVIVRGLNSGLSNVRYSRLFPLDYFGKIDGKDLYYLVPKTPYVNHTDNYTLYKTPIYEENFT